MRFGVALTALALAPAGLTGPAGPSILPFAEVRAGMRGTGKTVFEGTTVETFDVEILGTLPNVGPGQNLILARLSGGPLADTGVMAGMSGSPVFVDGRLVGAVAYGWGFAKEAIAGLSPIEEMLRVPEASAGSPHAAAAAGWPAAGRPRLPPSGRTLSAWLGELRSRLAPAGGPQALPLPLAVGGLGSSGYRRIGDELHAAGFVPLQAGTGGGPSAAAAALEPGAAVGIKLVRGDIDLTATGTVTWVDGDRVLVFGHPLFGLGTIDLPLTAARVEALLPSLERSARIATPLAEVGAARQDRASGVAGILGAAPQMIPVRVQLSTADGEHRFAFDVADDPLLSPLLLYYSLQGILAASERAFGTASLRLREGSVIQLFGGADVELDNLFAGPEALDYGTGISPYLLYLLMNNSWERPRIVGVNLLLEYEEEPRTARIRRATLDRYRAVAGDTVEATVVLDPYRGPERIVKHEFVVPPDTPPGRLTIAIGGALAVTREDDADEPVLPRDLQQLVWLVNQLRRNDRIYIVARRDDAGVLLGGARLPNLPPSAAALLGRPGNEGNLVSISERSVLEEVVATDYAVAGLVRIEIEVRAP